MLGPLHILFVDTSGSPVGTPSNPLYVIPATIPAISQNMKGRWGRDHIVLVASDGTPIGTPAQPLQLSALN